MCTVVDVITVPEKSLHSGTFLEPQKLGDQVAYTAPDVNYGGEGFGFA